MADEAASLLNINKTTVHYSKNIDAILLAWQLLEAWNVELCSKVSCPQRKLRRELPKSGSWYDSAVGKSPKPRISGLRGACCAIGTSYAAKQCSHGRPPWSHRDRGTILAASISTHIPDSRRTYGRTIGQMPCNLDIRPSPRVRARVGISRHIACPHW